MIYLTTGIAVLLFAYLLAALIRPECFYNKSGAVIDNEVEFNVASSHIIDGVHHDPSNTDESVYGLDH
jgi:K+-transporting ATPase KdpF subunit